MTTAASTVPAKTISKARMTPKLWAEAEALWESGEVTLDDLAKKFSKSRGTFQRHFKENKIERGSAAEATKAAVKQAVQSSVADDAAILASRIKETREDHYKMSAAISKLVWSEILTAKQKETPFANIKENLKSLETAMKVIQMARMERFSILGLDGDSADDDDTLPELVISELTADQIEKMRQKDESDLEDLAVDVEIEVTNGQESVMPTGPDGDGDDDEVLDD